MNFQKNEKCVVFPEGKIKTIVDFEYISGIDLYYMSDMTAYPKERISKVSDVENYFLNMDEKKLALLLVDENGDPLNLYS